MHSEEPKFTPHQPSAHHPDSKLKNLVGQKFHWLTVIARAANTPRGKTVWLCRCECGTEKSIRADHLNAGKIKSCGCKANQLLSELDRSPKMGYTKNVWDSMKDRCYYPSTPSYPRYGGAGVRVCDGWRYSLDNFIRDVGERPYNMTLDRINCLGHYSCGKCDHCKQMKWPANCRWADKTTQQRNRCLHLVFEYDGVKLPLRAFIRHFDIEELLFLRMLRGGWPVDLAVQIGQGCRPKFEPEGAKLGLPMPSII